jgi:hypothetical protein
MFSEDHLEPDAMSCACAAVAEPVARGDGAKQDLATRFVGAMMLT